MAADWATTPAARIGYLAVSALPKAAVLDALRLATLAIHPVMVTAHLAF